MKVLQVAAAYYPATVYGGPTFSIHYVCQALARLGVQVHVCTTNANGGTRLDVPTDHAVAFEPNYSVRYYNETIIDRLSWDFTFNAWRDFKSADIIHLQEIMSLLTPTTLLLARLLNKPVLITPRGVLTVWALTNKRPWLKKAWLATAVRPFVSNSRRITWHATSEAERGEILGHFSKAKVHVVPNGIDCAVIDAAPVLSAAEYFARFFPDSGVAPDRARILVGMGRLHPVKGFDIAIKAFHILTQKHPDIVLLIAGGDSGERRALERLILELGLSGRVALVGELHADDKIAFLKRADLFLIPSHSENFGMVALEALAAGVPVVASRNTPWAEIEPAGAGLWVDNTPEAFADAINELLLRNLFDMRKSARAHAARYDLSAIAVTFKQIYLDLIDAWRRQQ